MAVLASRQKEKVWGRLTGMDISRIDLNLLKALDALLYERNVTRAAERMYVTQQAMSGSLHRLRQHFDDDLLVRVGRHLELSPLGGALARPVREALLSVQAALSTRPGFEPSTEARRFRIAMSDYVSFVLLPGLLRHLAVEAPNVSCHVEALTEASVQKLEQGELDFFLGPTEWPLYGDYRPSCAILEETLFDDDFVCVVDASHPDVREVMSLDLYRRLPHNALALGERVASIVEQGWCAAGLDLKISATSPTFSGLIFMLPGTRLVCTAQRRLAHALAPALNLRILECPVRMPALSEKLSWHERNTNEPAHAYFRKAVAAAATSIPYSGASELGRCTAKV